MPFCAHPTLSSNLEKLFSTLRHFHPAKMSTTWFTYRRTSPGNSRVSLRLWESTASAHPPHTRQSTCTICELCVASSGPHSRIASSGGVKSAQTDASDSEGISRNSLRFPGISNVAVVCSLMPLALRHGRRLASLLVLPVHHRLGRGEERFSTVSMPGLETAVSSVEDETGRPPFAALILFRDNRRNSFGVKRWKKTLSAATRPAGSCNTEFEDRTHLAMAGSDMNSLPSSFDAAQQAWLKYESALSIMRGATFPPKAPCVW